MSVRVAINGFGRIGRNVFRAARERGTGFEIVAVNDLMDPPMAAHLLRYDTVHGRFGGEVEAADDGLVVDGRDVRVLSQRDPADLPWAEMGVEVVVESTGLFTKREAAAKHLTAGARKVIISAPATEPDITICIGVNDDRYDAAEHHVISNASCTTNCLAPLAKVLIDSVRHRARLHDHHPRLHAGPADPRRGAQGSAPRPRGRRERDPDVHRRRQGDRPGHPRDAGQARRHLDARPGDRRIGHRPGGGGGARDHPRRGERRVRGGCGHGHDDRASSSTAPIRSSRATSSASRTARSSTRR